MVLEKQRLGEGQLLRGENGFVGSPVAATSGGAVRCFSGLVKHELKTVLIEGCDFTLSIEIWPQILRWFPVFFLRPSFEAKTMSLLELFLVSKRTV